jgi:hypothetical protein
MEIKPIVAKADHRAALKEIEALMSARLGTPEGMSLIGRKGFCEIGVNCRAR